MSATFDRNLAALALTARAKWAFTTRRVCQSDAAGLLADFDQARPGDLLLGRVVRIGFQKRLQLASGRPADLYPGDLVVLACGARYAPDQFEGLAELDGDEVDLLAAGGVAGRMRQRNAKVGTPTRIAPIGLISDGAGRVINVADYALAARPAPHGLKVIAVVGASMNSGKTTASAALAHGLQRAGFEVAAIKATGTGAFGDFNTFVDAGARYVGDFTDVGMVSTYDEALARIEAGLDTLLAHATDAGCEIAVVELADGVLQQETAALLRRPALRRHLAGVMFAAPDALAAVGGCAVLRDIGLAPFGLTGTLCLSPLGALEAEAATGLTVMSREDLCDPAHASALLAGLRATMPAQAAA
jgi:hypothetical protein